MAKLVKPSILSVLDDYGLEYKQVGNNYFTFCLWHADGKTPNMCIYPESDTFYCFTCKKYGSVENIIAKLENKTYYEVVKMLYGDNYEFRKLGEGIKTVDVDTSFMMETLSRELRNQIHNTNFDIERVPHIVEQIINGKLDMCKFKYILKEIRNG